MMERSNSWRLAIKARLARSLAGRDPHGTIEMLSQIEADMQGALDDLRDLARGIRALRPAGLPDPMPVDVAVFDTGIDPSHPDLNVVGGVDCAPGSGWEDVEGHGTMVGGFIGARDNAIGVVGVAPDVRLWSVRVADRKGFIKDSSLLCGLDWVSQTSDVIRVANLSLTGDGADTGDCGNAEAKKDQDPVHQAICHVVGVGVTVVVAAGNDTHDAGLNYPASYDEVITVSAMSDRDAQPGGLGGQFVCEPTEFDDTFATYSNFGADIDIAAPGTCILSTYLGGLYATSTGTSFATPIVAGAAALYIVTHPGATPGEVKQALISIPGSQDPSPVTRTPSPKAS